MLEITAKADLLVKKYNMLSHGDFVVVGVSGGPDSMALLCYLLSKREELDLRILVANVEHGIRGKESVADTEFVKQFCKSKDVEFATISINAVDEAKQNSLGVEEYPRMATGSQELDRVLGGGIIPGSMILIVGDPGIGKSSLTLKVCANEGIAGRQVLYVTGEESIQQVRMRADRLQALADGVMVVSETNLELIEQHIANLKPEMVVIDSIQTMYNEVVSVSTGRAEYGKCGGRMT